MVINQFAPHARLVFYTSTGETIDVSDNDLLTLDTTNGVNRETGQWSCTLTGRQVGGRGFEQRIRAMDYCEIELARVPSSGGSLILTMRGFVDNVRMTRTATTRRVQVSGRNFGKFLIKSQIFFLAEVDPAASLVPEARLEEQYGVGVGLLTPAQFVARINEQIIAPNLNHLQAANPKIPDLRLGVTVPDRFAVNGFTVQPYTGSVWNLLTQYADQPWIEVFIADAMDGSTLRYRFGPYKDYAGQWLPIGTERLRTITIAPSDIIEYSVGTSDNDVFCCYFTSPQDAMISRIGLKAESVDLQARNPYFDEATFRRYGFYPLERSTSLIPSLTAEAPDTAKQMRPQANTQAAELNRWMIGAFQDNARYESGTILVAGGGGIQPGEYVSIPDSGYGREFYISTVAHSFDASAGSFTTSLDVVRGRPANTERTQPG